MKSIVIQKLSDYFELILLLNLLFRTYFKSIYLKIFLGVLLILSIISVIKTGKRNYSKPIIYSFILILLMLIIFGKINLI